MQRRQFLRNGGIALASAFGAANAAGAASGRREAPDPAVRSMSVETGPGLVREPRHEVTREGSLVHVSGAVQGTDGCAALAYDDVVGGVRRGTVDLTRVSDGQLCTQAMTTVAYDLTLAYDAAPPSRLDVRVTDQAVNRPIVRSYAVSKGEGGESHDVQRRPALNRAVVSGTVLGSDACTGYQYAGTERSGDAATVVLESVHSGDRLCAQVVTPIDYELVLEFPAGLPDRIDVETR